MGHEFLASLYDRISKGKMSVDEITQSMRYATSEGGKFFGSMEKQSQTLNGQLSTLKDNADQLLGSLTFTGNFHDLKGHLRRQSLMHQVHHNAITGTDNGRNKCREYSKNKCVSECCEGIGRVEELLIPSEAEVAEDCCGVLRWRCLLRGHGLRRLSRFL